MPGRARRSTVAGFVFQDLPCSRAMLTSHSQKRSSLAFEERSATAGRVVNNARQRITMPKAREEANPSQRGLHGDRSRKYSSRADCSVYSIPKGMFPAGPFYRTSLHPQREARAPSRTNSSDPRDPPGVRTREVLGRAPVDDATDWKGCKGWRIPLGPPP